MVAGRDDAQLSCARLLLALRPAVTPAEMAGYFPVCRRRMALYKRPRRLQFMPELVKTTSGKLRRVELREQDDRLRQHNQRGYLEFMESDFAGDLRANPPQGGDSSL